MQELYANDFAGFMKARQKLLMVLVSLATGYTAPPAPAVEEGDAIPTDIATAVPLNLLTLIDHALDSPL